MAYRVEVSARAARDLAYIYERIHAFESIAAFRWFNGLETALDGLARLPRRCPAAPESNRTGRPLRHLLYGHKPNVYRVIYEIDESKKVVWVLTVRHGAREEAGLADLA